MSTYRAVTVLPGGEVQQFEEGLSEKHVEQEFGVSRMNQHRRVKLEAKGEDKYIVIEDEQEITDDFMIDLAGGDQE